jgi:putative flippase GtrA
MLSKPIVKYFFVALAGLLVDYLTLYTSVEYLSMHPLVGATLGFLSGLLVNYYLSNKYIFTNAKIKSNAINFIAFSVIGLVGLLLLNIIMFIQIEFLAINYLIAKTIATVLVYFWNYFARSKLYHETR